MRLFNVIVFGFAAICIHASAATAETYCAKHDKLAEILDTKFGEQQIGAGLAGHEAMVELFVSKGGTFTLVSTNTSGVSCIVGAGDSWEKVERHDAVSAM
jgi:hypothetical protein